VSKFGLIDRRHLPLEDPKR